MDCGLEFGLVDRYRFDRILVVLTKFPAEPVMNAIMNAMEPFETPCIQVCALHPVWRLCSGCGRSLQEIEAWLALGAETRAKIMGELPLRLKAMTSAGIAPAA